VKSTKKKSAQTSAKTATKTASPEIASPNSGGNGNKDERRKAKKKSKKIKRIKKPGSEDTESGDDEYTILSKQSTKSTKSSRSTKSSESLRSKVSKAKYNKNTKNRVSKQYKETSSRVQAIREPILSNEGVIIKDEMDNLFPLPNSPGKPVGKAKRRSSMGKTNGVESNANCDTDDLNIRRSSKSKMAPQSQKSLNSGGSAGSYGIMTNKAAAEQAEAALNRVAAHQQMEMNNSNSGGSEGSVGERPFPRRFSNGSTRSKDQYQRLHRDSGLTSLTSINDDADAASYSSRRSQSNFTAMSALHKRMDEYKVETENLQKRLYEALAEVEQSNKNLRREKERADAVEGKLSGVKSELENVREEKLFLIESVRDMETEFVAKDERVEKLQEVVETQLDTVEFLEDKLNKTEEELVLMEEEMTELIDVVEEKNKTVEQINEVKEKGQGRVARMVTMREDMISRRGSIKLQKEELRQLLLSPDDTSKSSDRVRMKNVMAPVSEGQKDVGKLENKLITREAKLKADQDECNNREQRLDTWERELFDLEDQLKKESEKISHANQEAASQNSDHELLITSLEEEKEALRRVQVDNQSKLKKLEFENEDLHLKLDRVTKMMADKKREIPAKNNELKDALALVDEKNKLILSLEEKIEKLSEKGQSDKSEEEGKDLLIRELQNQLVNTKKEANSLSSGSYVTRLKLEIKKLRESVRDLKKKMKEEEATWRSNLQKKDDAMKLLEKQMAKLKIELERREKREKNLGTDQRLCNSDLQNHIEDLEDDISHWKSINADLENEIESLKARTYDQNDYYLSEDDIEDDDCSIGSLASVNSRMSLSVSHEDNFFLTESNHSISHM